MRVVDHRLYLDDGTAVPLVPTQHMGGALKPEFLIVHATSMLGVEQVLRWRQNPQAKVSTHLLIARDGSITQVVPFDRVAWHAGQSAWHGRTNFNGRSIALELENAGKLRRDKEGRFFGTPPGREIPETEVIEAQHRHENEGGHWHRYTEAQLKAAREAAAVLVQTYGLKEVLGHEDVARKRKTDPGPAFPMEEFRAFLLGRRHAVPFESSEAPGSVSEEAAAGGRYSATVLLNVRSAPEASGDKLPGSPLPVGTELQQLETRGDWMRVRVAGSVNGVTDVEGWVHSQFIQPLWNDADDPAEESGTSVPVAPTSVAHLAAEYGLSTSTQSVIARAMDYAASASPPRRVDSMMLLISLAEHGRESGNPESTADWLRAHLGGSYDTLRERHLESRDLNSVASTAPDTAAAPLAAQTRSALATARDLAERTTGSPSVHTRHLMAALLLEPPGSGDVGVLAVLAQHHLDPAALRASLLEFVSGTDDDNAWGSELLGHVIEEHRASTYNADATGGKDHLGIEPDVRAFAALIAARTLAPPLSIGLFGEWGSGKTFFMRKLRDEVARLARESREANTVQRELPFYKRIVQIEFNAWHYSEGNLWASLVQHIFENLRVLDERRRPASEHLQEPLLRQLGVEKAAEARAKRERAGAKAECRAAERSLREARLCFEKEAKKLARVSAANFLADVKVQDVQSQVSGALHALGLVPLASDARQLHAALGDARALLTRGTAVLAPLHDPERRDREWSNLMLALLAGPLAAVLAGGVLLALGAEGIATVSALAAGLAAMLERGTRWLKRNTGTVRGWLDSVEKAHRELETRIARAQEKNAVRVREAEEMLRLREADYAAAKRREEEARARVAEAEARLREASVARLLSSFIEERANSTDYRKHLGVLALIRNDFERLSDLIEEENWRLSSPAEGEEEARWTSTRFETLTDESVDEGKRINRIVLYIDDLDRCAPDKVVEVLQAVHLLLAFPLFVVVVGVDARWVTRSLEARYRDTLRGTRPDAIPGGGNGTAPQPEGAGSNGDDEFREVFGTATPHDYLEKIFQVPFWLRPMNDYATRRMVGALLRSNVNPAGTSVSGLPVPADNGDHDAADNGAFAGFERVRGELEPSTQEIEAAASPPDRWQDEERDPDSTDEVEDATMEVAEQAGAESLEVTEPELRFIRELAPLLGRSPRAVKRFVNVYRLVKVRLSRHQREVFMRETADLPEYQAVLLLLAIDTGAPLIARELFEALQKDGRADGPVPSLEAVLNDIAVRHRLQRQPEWVRVSQWISARSPRLGSAAVSRLQRNVARVARFSFHSNRASSGVAPAASTAGASA